MAICSFARWVGGVPATNYSTNGTPKIGIVQHVIVGTANSAMSEFQTSGSKLSAHFVVSGPLDPYSDGTIFQMLDTDLAAYAQAAGNFSPTAYIAVEFSGYPDTALSAAQLNAAAQLLVWASRTHGFPIQGEVAHGEHGQTTHCNPDGSPDPAWGNHDCPGAIRLGQVPEIVSLAQQIANPPAPPQEHDMASPITFTPAEAFGAPSIFYIDANGHVQQLYYVPNNNPKWIRSDLTAVTNSPAAALT